MVCFFESKYLLNHIRHIRAYKEEFIIVYVLLCALYGASGFLSFLLKPKLSKISSEKYRLTQVKINTTTECY